MSTTRQGPALTITGTCEGCCHLAGTGNDLACRHPDAPPGATPYETLVGIEPVEGCPLLPAARLTLARGIVAEADRAQAEADQADIRRRMRMTPAEVMADSAAHGAGESEE